MISQPRFSTGADGGDFSARPDHDNRGSSAGQDPAAEPKVDPLSQLGRQFAELKAYVWQRWAVRIDRVSLGVRRLLMAAAMGVLGLVALTTGLIVSVVMLLDGAAGGIAELLDGRRWLANIIVGAGALALTAIVFMVGYAAVARASNQRARAKYERRQTEQRRRFGHSSTERASRGATERASRGATERAARGAKR